MGKNSKFSLEDLLKEVGLQTKTAEETAKEEEKKEEEKAEEKKEEEKKEEEKKEEEKKEARMNSNSPVNDAMKLAEKLASMQKEALQKEAELIGKAIYDGFVSRMHQYEKVAAEHAPASNEVDLEKVAYLYQNDPEFKASFDQGYVEKIAEELEKDPAAKQAFIAGYEKTAGELIKVAQHLRDKGYADCGRVVATLTQSV